jgi:hypothetical protein
MRDELLGRLMLCGRMMALLGLCMVDVVFVEEL